MFRNVEFRHLRAVIILAEELNFTRAAHRLHITQSTLSKQITEIEERHGFHLFTRDNKRVVEITDTGRVFVEEARSLLLHQERALHLAHAAENGGDHVLVIGHSLFADQAWVSALLAIRPMYPKLRLRLITKFSVELVRSVIAGELNLALVTAPPEDSQITAVPFAQMPLYAVLPQTHPAAQKEHIGLRDLANDEWIIWGQQVHPFVHEAIMDTAQRVGIGPKHAHDIITAQHAVHLVTERVGAAILTKPTALALRAEGVLVKPLSDPSLCFQTYLIIRTDERSQLASQFARSFLRKLAPQHVSPMQMELPLSA